jgi:hypothetical protein
VFPAGNPSDEQYRPNGRQKGYPEQEKAIEQSSAERRFFIAYHNG